MATSCTAAIRAAFQPPPQDPFSQFPPLGILQPLPLLRCEQHGRGRRQWERRCWGNEVLGDQGRLGTPGRRYGQPRPRFQSALPPPGPQHYLHPPSPPAFPHPRRRTGSQCLLSPPPPPSLLNSSPVLLGRQNRNRGQRPLRSSPRVLLPLPRFLDFIPDSGIRPSAPGVGAAPGPRVEAGSYGDSREMG